MKNQMGEEDMVRYRASRAKRRVAFATLFTTLIMVAAATASWADDVNAKGGLLERPVKLIFYDDQTNPSIVPGLYTKLIDVDKVDLVIAGYGTNVEAPAMPIVIERGMVY